MIGAGRDTNGTIYVLDRGRPEYRAFVSAGSVLQRKKVLGTGSSDGWTVASVADGSAPFTLKVEAPGGAAARMGIFRGDLHAKGAKDFDIGTEGEVLELVTAAAYGAHPVRNLPAATVVEYDASTEDGHRLVLMRPETDWGYEDFRLFYGTPDQMVERKLTSASRGAATYLTFTMDGASYDVYLPSAHSDGRPAKLTGNGATQLLTYRNADAGPLGAGLSYLCL